MHPQQKPLKPRGPGPDWNQLGRYTLNMKAGSSDRGDRKISINSEYYNLPPCVYGQQFLWLAGCASDVFAVYL